MYLKYIKPDDTILLIHQEDYPILIDELEPDVCRVIFNRAGETVVKINPSILNEVYSKTTNNKFIESSFNNKRKTGLRIGKLSLLEHYSSVTMSYGDTYSNWSDQNYCSALTVLNNSVKNSKCTVDFYCPGISNKDSYKATRKYFSESNYDEVFKILVDDRNRNDVNIIAELVCSNPDISLIPDFLINEANKIEFNLKQLLINSISSLTENEKDLVKLIRGDTNV